MNPPAPTLPPILVEYQPAPTEWPITPSIITIEIKGRRMGGKSRLARFLHAVLAVQGHHVTILDGDHDDRPATYTAPHFCPPLDIPRHIRIRTISHAPALPPPCPVPPPPHYTEV